ncbi:hypothetical protein D3C72_1703480 [compost metagenome]
MFGQVHGAECAARLAGEVGDLAGQFAAVEAFAAGFGDLAQGPGLVRETPPFAGLRRAALGQERVGKAGLGRQFGRLVGPLACDGGRHREAVFGIRDGGLEQLGEGQLAEAVRQGLPAGDLAGHGDGAPAGAGHGVSAVEVFGRPGGRRAAAGIQAMELAVVPDQGEHVAADPVHHGLDDSQGNRGGNGAVNGIATGQQHA